MKPTETIAEPYSVIAPGFISVCSACFPGEAIFNVFPDLRGQQISHGVCARHFNQFIKVTFAPTSAFTAPIGR